MLQKTISKSSTVQACSGPTSSTRGYTAAQSRPLCRWPASSTLLTLLTTSSKRHLEAKLHSAWEERKIGFPMVTAASREVCLQLKNNSSSYCTASIIRGTWPMGCVNRHDAWFHWLWPGRSGFEPFTVTLAHFHNVSQVFISLLTLQALQNKTCPNTTMCRQK